MRAVERSDSDAVASEGRLPKGEARRKIVAAALDLFSSRPYDEVTITDIANAAGVAKGLMFHYFDNKRGLYLASLEVAVRELTVAHDTNPADPPGVRIRELLAKHLEHLAEHEQLALNLILRGVGGDWESWQTFEGTRWEMIQWACGLLGLDSDREVIQMVWRAFAGAADEATAYWLRHDRPLEVDVMVEGLIEILAGALQAATRWDESLDVRRAVSQLRRPRPSRRSA